MLVANSNRSITRTTTTSARRRARKSTRRRKRKRRRSHAASERRESNRITLKRIDCEIITNNLRKIQIELRRFRNNRERNRMSSSRRRLRYSRPERERREEQPQSHHHCHPPRPYSEHQHQDQDQEQPQLQLQLQLPLPHLQPTTTSTKTTATTAKGIKKCFKNLQPNNGVHFTTTTTRTTTRTTRTRSINGQQNRGRTWLPPKCPCAPLISLSALKAAIFTILLMRSICHNNVVVVAAATVHLSPTTTLSPLTSNTSATSTEHNIQVIQGTRQHLHHNHSQLDNVTLDADSGHERLTEFTTNHTFPSRSIIDGSLADAGEAVATNELRWTVEGGEKESLPVFDFGMPRNITARTGHTEATIKCRVDRLLDKSVSWIRKRDLHILTVGMATYTSDKRFQVTGSKDSRDWTLHVKAPQARDSGIYECQVNTEPKMSMAFQLNIIEISPDARAVISGPADRHFKVGSVIVLSCVVQQPSVRDIGPIYWYRGEHMITPVLDAAADNNENDQTDATHGAAGVPPIKVAANAISDSDAVAGDLFYTDSEREMESGTEMESGAEAETEHMRHVLMNEITADFAGRIAMESQLGDTLKSRLRISNAQTTDTGNYTCQPTTASSASVMVHVINDENPAAMQKSAAAATMTTTKTMTTTTTRTTLCGMSLAMMLVGLAAWPSAS